MTMPAAAINLRLNLSRQLAVYLLAIHLLALFSLIFVVRPGWAWFLAAGLLLFSLVVSWQQLLGRLRPRALQYVEGGWQIAREAGFEPVLLRRATVWSWLLVLEFINPVSGRSSLLLMLPDSCDADSQRQLRILLRNRPVFSAIKPAG